MYYKAYLKDNTSIPAGGKKKKKAAKILFYHHMLSIDGKS